VQLVPGIAALLSFREYGPSVVAAMVACKVGAGFTAEIGGMKTTDQLDSLELMGVNLVHYLLVPRLAACIMMQVCLSIIGVFCAFMAGFLVNIFHSNFQMYLGIATEYVGWADFINLMFKALALSWIVPVVSCYFGMKAMGGAQGVGEATTKAVVIEILMIIIGDFTISAVADKLISAVI
jgi:phospholipid/cholesterol/gamma-HCH transport system permease protein